MSETEFGKLKLAEMKSDMKLMPPETSVQTEPNPSREEIWVNLEVETEQFIWRTKIIMRESCPMFAYTDSILVELEAALEASKSAPDDEKEAARIELLLVNETMNFEMERLQVAINAIDAKPADQRTEADETFVSWREEARKRGYINLSLEEVA